MSYALQNPYARFANKQSLPPEDPAGSVASNRYSRFIAQVGPDIRQLSAALEPVVRSTNHRIGEALVPQLTAAGHFLPKNSQATQTISAIQNSAGAAVNPIAIDQFLLRALTDPVETAADTGRMIRKAMPSGIPGALPSMNTEDYVNSLIGTAGLLAGAAHQGRVASPGALDFAVREAKGGRPGMLHSIVKYAVATGEKQSGWPIYFEVNLSGTELW